MYIVCMPIRTRLGTPDRGFFRKVSEAALPPIWKRQNRAGSKQPPVRGLNGLLDEVLGKVSAECAYWNLKDWLIYAFMKAMIVS
jgi:hypothetical protein